MKRAVTLGVFDGLHLGHRQLVDRLLAEAASRDLLPSVVTLDPHPDVVLGHSPARPPLTPRHTQAAILAEWGARELRILNFDQALRQVTAESFARDYLADRLEAGLLVVGPDFALGRGREGTPERLRELGGRWGFEVIQVEPSADADGRISSSRVRHLLDQGRVEEVGRLLGRKFLTEGRVVPGRGIGGGLGFPTANLERSEPVYLPADGVYVGRASGFFGERPALVSLGTRPTFGPGERVLEVYLMDFQGDLRNHWLRLEWLSFLRGQQKFHSPADLIEQMREDERLARLQPGISGGALRP
jgi:riboflavin kinase/FMN adenylyltransferase